MHFQEVTHISTTTLVDGVKLGVNTTTSDSILGLFGSSVNSYTTASQTNPQVLTSEAADGSVVSSTTAVSQANPKGSTSGAAGGAGVSSTAAVSRTNRIETQLINNDDENDILFDIFTYE